MKRSKKMIALLCALAVMIGGYYLVRGMGKKDSVSESSGTFDLTAKTADDLAGISWTADGKDWTFTLEDGIWKTSDSPEWPVNQEVLQTLAESLVNLQATRRIENVTSLADYGLAEPAITVTASWKDGGSTACSMGEATPFEDGYYLAVSGQDQTIYTIATSLKATFSKTLTDMAAMEEIPAVAEVTGLSVSAGLNAVKKSVSETVDPDQLWYDADTGEALDGSEIETLVSAAAGLKWKALETVGATEEELKNRGLDDAQARALVLTGGGATATVLIGRDNEDGNYYARLPGSAMVYTVDASDISGLLSATGAALKAGSLLPMPYSALAYAEFETARGNCRIERAAEAAEGTEAAGDEAQEELWEKVTALKASGAPEKAGSGETVLRIHAANTDGKETEVVISEYSAEAYQAAVDGGNPALVDAGEIDELARAVRAMQ